MANVAAFTINATASEDPVTGDRKYEATNGEVLTVTLEQNPSSVISVTYAVADTTDPGSPLASKSAPAITWTSNGLPSVTPSDKNGSETITLPVSGTHSYIIRATASTLAGQIIFERLVIIRGGSIRKTVPAESQQGENRGWSDAINEMVDAIAGGGGGETLSQTLALGNTTGGLDIQMSAGDALAFLGEIDIQRSATTLIASDSSLRLLFANATEVRFDNDVPIRAETTTPTVFANLITLSASNAVVVGNGTLETQLQFGTVLTMVDAGVEVFRFSDSTGTTLVETVAGVSPRDIILRAGAATGSNPGGNLTLQAGDSVSGSPGAIDLYADGAVRVQVNPAGSTFSVTDYAVLFQEVAAVPGGAPASTLGKLWVRSDVPNVLIFTDDVGTDWTLNTGLGGESLAATLAIGNTTGAFDVDVAAGQAIDFQGEIAIQRQGVSLITSTAAGVAEIPGSLGIGTFGIPSTGTVRVGHGANIVGRNDANDANVNVVRWGAVVNDTITIGENSANCDGLQYLVGVGTHRFDVNGLESWTIGEQVATLRRAAVAATVAEGAKFENPTLATAGTQVQRSPASVWIGHGWDVDGAVDRQVKWAAQAVPVAGNDVAVQLDFSAAIEAFAGGVYSRVLSLQWNPAASFVGVLFPNTAEVTFAQEQLSSGDGVDWTFVGWDSLNGNGGGFFFDAADGAGTNKTGGSFRWNAGAGAGGGANGTYTWEVAGGTELTLNGTTLDAQSNTIVTTGIVHASGTTAAMRVGAVVGSRAHVDTRSHVVVQTTNDTVTTVATIDASTQGIWTVTANVTAFEAATTDACFRSRTAAFHSTGAALTQLGSTINGDSGTAEKAGAAAWAVTITSSGTDILVRVQGENAHTIDWKPNVQVQVQGI